MIDRELQRRLEQLQEELRRVGAPDEEEREILRSLSEEIDALLSRDERHEQQYRGLAGRLRDAAAKLEASHPRATLLMRGVIDSLAYLGV
ncbi:MAG TPA: DUF4404 family protein [Pyrinomonadaceae bacterium]|nr:DUF4404 family protein [Pyrinomonadaceae bacterium]